MEYPIVFGVLLMAAGGSSVACGLYAIQNNIKTTINRVFLAFGCAMLLWCVGLAITVVARDEVICSFGRRLSPLGWGTICNIVLHFVLLLTKKHQLLKKWWIYPILYLPSAVSIFAFSYLPLIHLNQDQLIHNELGWLNISHTDGWDWFYYGYCFFFIAIAIVIIYKWAKNSTSQNIKKQVRLLMSSMLAATVLGSLTDILPVFLKIRTPQFSPVFALFPIAAISYSVKYYSFMRPEAENQNELILHESAYTNVYRYISIIFVVGSVLNLAAQLVLVRASLLSVFLFSGALIALAAFILLIHHTKLDDSMKEMLLAAAISFTIPAVSLWFVDSGGTTIWMFVFLLMIICLLFNRRTILITVIVSSVLTQLLLWAAAPAAQIKVDGSDYIVRIGVIGLAALLSLYVNKVYVQRLKENTRQISMQMLVSEISHDFVSANEQNFYDKVSGMLERCGSFIKSDRAYVILIDPNEKCIRNSFEWVAEGVLPQSDFFEESVTDMHSALLKQFEVQNLIIIHDAGLMPTTEKIKNYLVCRDVRAFLALPVKKQDVIIGFLTFTADQPLTQWRSESFTYLEIITNIFADAVIKIDAEKEIKFIAYHDQLTLLPNRVLFMDRLEKTIKRAAEDETKFAIAFLDLDSFKIVNDTMGHELGDQLLFEVAKMLSRVIRSSDMISRFGGDEFIILLNDITSETDVVKIMVKIMDVLRRPIYLNEREFYISASVGIALYPQDGNDAKALIKDADSAMYSAKTRGKNQYIFCSRVMEEQALENGS